MNGILVENDYLAGQSQLPISFFGYDPESLLTLDRGVHAASTRPCKSELEAA
jgi:hypothetical protein